VTDLEVAGGEIDLEIELRNAALLARIEAGLASSRTGSSCSEVTLIRFGGLKSMIRPGFCRVGTARIACDFK
jgi:hypothetical protein